MSIKKLLLKSMCFLTVFTFLFTQMASPGAALPIKQKKLHNQDIQWTDLDACAGTDSTPIEAGRGAPDGTLFPNLDPEAMAAAIDKYIEEVNPDSRMKGLGQTIVAGAENSDINPFLIVAIAQKESILADPGDYNVRHGNNAFGRTATSSQPNFQGARLWYKWTSVEASVDHTAQENRGATGGGDIAAYLRAQYGGKLDRGDLESFMNEYAPSFENDTSTYIDNIRDWMKDMIGLTKRSGGGGSDASTRPRRSVYMMGDSIVWQARGILNRTFNTNSFDSYINGTGGRSITQPGGVPENNRTSGMEALEEDKNRIARADIIIINLGGNQKDGNPASFKRAVGEMIDKIQTINDKADVFWVNILVNVRNKDKANQAINSVAAAKDVTVIDADSLNVEINPGPDRHPTNNGYREYARHVVKEIGNNTEEPAEVEGNVCCPDGGTSLVGNDNEAKVWNYFADKGLPPKAIAGIMGNIAEESSFNPRRQQINGPAYGLIQWDPVAGVSLEDWLREADITTDKWALETQLNLLWWHMTTPGKTPPGKTFNMNAFKNMDSVEETTTYFEETVEAAGDPRMADRIRSAVQAFNKYSGRGDTVSAPSSGNGCFGGTGQASGDFIWPIDKVHPISSCWNTFRSYYNGGAGGGHSGMDISAPRGTEIVAADGGKVELARNTDDGGFGVTVIINHGNGLWSLYAHLVEGSITVAENDSVSQGQKIGQVNDTGHSFGDHLHFNIQKQGGEQGTSAGTTNPLAYLPEDGRGNPNGCDKSPSGGPTGHNGPTGYDGEG